MAWPIFTLYDVTTSPYSRVQTTLNASSSPIIVPTGKYIGGSASGGAGDLYYLDHVAGRVTGREDLDLATSTSGSHALGLKNYRQIYDIQGYITDETFNESPTGTWTIYTETKQNGSGVGFGQAVFQRIQIKKRNNGTETLLFTTSWQVVGTVPSIKTQSTGSSGSFAGDYLVLVVQAKWDVGGPS